MNTQYAGKIKRPEGVPDTDPVPVPVHNPLSLHLTVKWVIGGAYKNLHIATKWITIKSSLAALDSAAEIHLESGQAGDPFTVTNYLTGDMDILIPTAEMSTLVVGTLYYVDVQVLDASEPYTILYDTIRPYQQVTKAVAASP